MGMYSEILLVRFLLDILKSSLVDLHNSAGSLIDVGKEFWTNDVWTIERVPNIMQGLTRGD